MASPSKRTFKLICSTSARSWYSHMRTQHNPCELLVDLWHISGVLSLPLDRRAILCPLNPLLPSLQRSILLVFAGLEGCKVTYANNSAPRFDLGSFWICFLFYLFVLLLAFGSSTFPESWKTSSSLGRWIPGSSLFRRYLGSSDLGRFCLPSIYLVVDVWRSLVMVETQMVSA